VHPEPLPEDGTESLEQERRNLRGLSSRQTSLERAAVDTQALLKSATVDLGKVEKREQEFEEHAFAEMEAERKMVEAQFKELKLLEEREKRREQEEPALEHKLRQEETSFEQHIHQRLDEEVGRINRQLEHELGRLEKAVLQQVDVRLGKVVGHLAPAEVRAAAGTKVDVRLGELASRLEQAEARAAAGAKVDVRLGELAGGLAQTEGLATRGAKAESIDRMQAAADTLDCRLLGLKVQVEQQQEQMAKRIAEVEASVNWIIEFHR